MHFSQDKRFEKRAQFFIGNPPKTPAFRPGYETAEYLLKSNGVWGPVRRWPAVSGDQNFTGEKQPLIEVNWTEAKGICEKQGKRLPTESEWEYAARGGSANKEYGTDDGTLHEMDTYVERRANCAAFSSRI